MTKYCRDCSFAMWHPTRVSLRVCEKGPRELVWGEPDENEAACREMRYRGACGPEGKLFEPKTPEAA